MKARKLIAPVVVTVILSLFFLFYLAMCLIMPMPIFGKVIGAVICLALIGVSVFVLVERIKEIRSGELDDLSKY